MIQAKRLLVLVGLALGPSACGRGCTCFEGEKTFEELHGKVEVSLVRKTHWTGGRIPGPLSDFYIRVETTPPFEVPIRCDHVDMAEDDAGKNVGFRCKGTKEWEVLRLRGGDRFIRECDAPVGVDSKPHFERLEPLRKSGPRILECEQTAVPSTMKELVRAVAEDDGKSAASDFAAEVAGYGFPEAGDRRDIWDDAIEVLDEAGRARARAGLCVWLERTGPIAYSRAAMRCPLDPPGVTTGAMAMLQNLVEGERKMPDRDTASEAAQDLALLWSGLIAGSKMPKEAGAVVCSGVAVRDRTYRTAEPTTLALLLAHTRTSCPALDAWLDPIPCDFRLDCDGGLCTAAELATEIEGWERTDAGTDAGARRLTPELPPVQRAMLAAVYARGALPRSIALPNARRRYEIVDGGSDLPSCNDDDLDAGVACDCERLGALDICKAPVDGGPIWHDGYCAIRIDDAHRQLRDIRRRCGGLGERCSPNEWCCPGTNCNAVHHVCEIAQRLDPDVAPDADSAHDE